MTTLMFRNTVLETISHNGQIWFTSIELAKALEYSRVDSVTRIYDRNKDEFTPCMTETVNLTVSRKSNSYDNLRNKIRIFSLRGAHLIAMFANTPIAKEFRKWVLDILDREAANPIYQSQTLGDLTGTAATAELAALVDKLQRIIHEGEFIPAGSRRNYNLPANRKHEQTIIRDFLTKDESSTILMLLTWLRADGFDMTAAERELDVIRGYVGSMRRSMGDIQTHAQYIDHAVRLVS